MKPLVIVACGAKKVEQTTNAGRLYTGALFRSSYIWACSAVGRDRILILSAKHGLLHPDDLVDPYDVRLGDPNSISVDGVQVQAIDLGLIDEPEVIVVGGKDYVRFARRVWPHALSFAEEAGGCTSLGAFRGRLSTFTGHIPSRVLA